MAWPAGAAGPDLTGYVAQGIGAFYATAWNSKLDVAGLVFDAGGGQPVLFDGAGLQSLGAAPDGATLPFVRGINDQRQVLINTFPSSGPAATYLASQTGWTPILVPGAYNTSGRSLNNRNEVVGSYTYNDAWGTASGGFHFRDGALTTFPPGALGSPPTAQVQVVRLARINDQGTVIGSQSISNVGSVAAPSPLNLTFSGPLTGLTQYVSSTGLEISAESLDRNGDFTGSFQTPDGDRVFVVRGGVYRELDLPSDLPWQYPLSVSMAPARWSVDAGAMSSQGDVAGTVSASQYMFLGATAPDGTPHGWDLGVQIDRRLFVDATGGGTLLLPSPDLFPLDPAALGRLLDLSAGGINDQGLVWGGYGLSEYTIDFTPLAGGGFEASRRVTEQATHFLYRDGAYLDLEAWLKAETGKDFARIQLVDVDDGGAILLTASEHGDDMWTSYILHPVPLPSAWVLALSALWPLGLVARRRQASP